MSPIRITRFVGALFLAQVLGGCATTEQAAVPPSSAYQRLGTGNVVPPADWPAGKQEFAAADCQPFVRLGAGPAGAEPDLRCANIVSPVDRAPAQPELAAGDCESGFVRPGVGPVGAEPPLRCKHDLRNSPSPAPPVGEGCIYAFGLLGALGPIGLPLMLIGAVGVCLPVAAVVGLAHAVVSQANAEPGAVRDR